MQELNKRIKLVTKDASQSEVAAKIGITQTKWGRISRGKTYPDAKVITSFCLAYKVDPTWLLFGDSAVSLDATINYETIYKQTSLANHTEGLASDNINRLEFAKRLKNRRTYFSLSQEKLAHDIEVSKTTIQNYEAGQYPTGEHAISLVRILECSLDWLLLGKEEREKSLHL